MKTKPIYLEDPYLKSMEATILDARLEKEGVWELILDKTVFYPMGGGQPTDQGAFVFEDGSKGEVFQVKLKEGEIVHSVKTTKSLSPSQKLTGTIDWERRLKNMKVHTAAHVIDFAMYLLKYSPSPLHPFKGDHGKKAHIIYQGSLGKDIKDELQKKTDELSEKNLKFSWSFEQLEDIEKEAIYLQPGLPKNKPLRALRLEGIGAVADGGTILATTKEAGKITILSIEDNGSETIIRYQTE